MAKVARYLNFAVIMRSFCFHRKLRVRLKYFGVQLYYTQITYGVSIDLLQANLRKAPRTSISKFRAL